MKQIYRMIFFKEKKKQQHCRLIQKKKNKKSKKEAVAIDEGRIKGIVRYIFLESVQYSFKMRVY